MERSVLKQEKLRKVIAPQDRLRWERKKRNAQSNAVVLNRYGF